MTDSLRAHDIQTSDDETVTTSKHRERRLFFADTTRRLATRLVDLVGPKAEVDTDAVSALLLTGYVPGTRTLLRGVHCLPGGCRVRLPSISGETTSVVDRFLYERHAGISESALAHQGIKALRCATDHALRRGGVNVLVPLSGGLDSRTLLGLLLEHLSPHEIQTYTYGIPGTHDFEIGNAVAQRAGTQHVSIDLRSMEFTYDRLLETARLTDANTSLFHPYVWTEVIRRFGKNNVVWSGFTGDGLGGSFYRPEQTDTSQAVRRFLHEASRHLTWYSNSSTAINHAIPLVTTDTKYDNVLTRWEAIWFENHVERYTAHHIFMNELTYEIPFMDDSFATFALNLGAHRKGKVLFNEMVRNAFPVLFELPTKSYGLALARTKKRSQAKWWLRDRVQRVLYRFTPISHPATSYLDFSRAVRERPDVRSLIAMLLNGLNHRQLLDSERVNMMWKLAQERGERSYDVIILASLEACLRVLEGSES